MQRSPITLALLGLLVASACGGGGDTSGLRVRIYELSIRGGDASGEDRRLVGTCLPGRLAIEFHSGDEITIKSGTRLVASLTAEEAFVGCPGARIEKPQGPPAQGLPYIVRHEVDVTDSTKLACATGKRINIRVHATYKFQDSFAGGSMVVWTRPEPHQRWGRALVVARFEEDEESRLISQMSYHAPRCRVSGSA
ncbi:MAG: hypothetical protein ABR521_03505 [Gaiellaceae bacterium]